MKTLSAMLVIGMAFPAHAQFSDYPAACGIQGPGRGPAGNPCAGIITPYSQLPQPTPWRDLTSPYPSTEPHHYHLNGRSVTCQTFGNQTVCR